MNNWQIKKLGEIVSVVTGKLDANAAVSDGKFPFYTCSQENSQINETAFNGESILLSGNGIFSVKYHKSGKFNAYQRVYVIQTKGTPIDLRYVYFFLEIEVPKLISQGGVIRYLRLPQLVNLEIFLPPLAVQKEIVTKLDEKMAGLREAKQLREQALADTSKILSQTLHEIFEEGKKKGWEEKEIKDICFNMYQGLNTAGEKVNFVDHGFPIIQSRNLEQGIIEIESKMKFMSNDDWLKYKDKFKPEIGDVLFSNIGTIGKVAIVTEDRDYLIHWNIFIFKIKKDLVLSKFFGYFLNKLISEDHYAITMTGATIKFITKKVIESTKIKFPPLAEQEKIVARLDTLSSQLRTLRELQASQLADMKRLEKAYLREAFKGEL